MLNKLTFKWKYL